MELSIIILSYNTKDLLKQTIDSIMLKENWEIIVVDNASSDGSQAMIEHDYPHIKLIKNNRNLGFAAANNLGIKIARGQYLMLLNSDTQVMDDCLSDLIRYLNQHKKVGIITPKVVLPDGAIDLACHRGMPTPWRSFTYFAKLERFFPNSATFGGYHLTHLDFNKPHLIEATAATAIITRRQVIKSVGLLDERFFLYAEDLDWCKRITEAGWSIIYYPQATILHHKSQSGKNNNIDREKKSAATEHFYDTMKQFYEKHYDNKYPKPLKKLIFLAIDIKKRFHR
jgi:GT2 family glycosyltransferase